MSTTGRETDWSTLSRTRVLFAHQSVGAEVLRGVEQLAADDAASLRIREFESGPLVEGISHFYVGRNGDPRSKIRGFAETMQSISGPMPDIALLKLCYIDFGRETDPLAIAQEYVQMIDELSRQYPDTKFVAVTAPLTTVQTGPKAWIKLLLGRRPGGLDENLKRREFNETLRAHFQSHGNLFDIARIESGGTFLKPGDVESLRPELTYDGGHLNGHGQVLVAEEFTALLTKLGSQSTVQ